MKKKTIKYIYKILKQYNVEIIQPKFIPGLPINQSLWVRDTCIVIDKTHIFLPLTKIENREKE